MLYGNGENPLIPGGVLLFAYNVSKDPLETFEFIKSIHDFYLVNENPPPFVAVDQEGGDVNRLRSLTSVLWSQKKVSESFSIEGAEKLYSAQARQMRNLGFHLNLAPVVEVETNANKEFLDTRTFGSLSDVLSYGGAAVDSYEKNRIAVVLKHFPGNSNADPHIGIPKINLQESDLQNYLASFEKLAPKSSAVLMSHIIAKIDGEYAMETEMPACFSEFWISEARKYLPPDSLIFSDDIFMGALAKNGYPPEIAAVKAIEAGVDVIMLSEKRFGHVAKNLLSKAVEDKKFSEELNRAIKNVIKFKIKAGILELLEKSDSESAEKNQVPIFFVRVNPNYADFNLYQFNEDYKSGMDAFNYSK